MFLLRFALLSSLLGATPAVFADGGTPYTRIVEVGGNPESVITYGNLVFASNLGSVRRSDLDGDGYISKLGLDGVLVERRFLPRPGDGVLNSPTGMVVLSDVLYVADVNRVVGFEIASGRRIFDVAAPDGDVMFLNDLAWIGGSRMAVSATDVKRLYALDYRTGQWARLGADLTFHHVNGLSFDRDHDTLYVAANVAPTLADNNGRFTAYTLAGETLTQEWELAVGRFLDGVTVLGGRHVLVSDWSDMEGGGTIHTIDTRSGTLHSTAHWGQRGLADFHFDRYSEIFVLPAMLTSQVHLVQGDFATATILACRSRDPSQFGEVRLELDEFRIARTVRFGEELCGLRYKSSSREHTWYEARPGSCAVLPSVPHGSSVTVTSFEGQGAFGIEVAYPREPDSCEHTRACNPSPIGYQQFVCAEF